MPDFRPASWRVENKISPQASRLMDILLAGTAAFAVTALSVPLAILVARKFGLVDDPSRRPHPAHIHTKVTPRAGGLAIYLGIVTASVLFLPLQKHLVGIILGITILLIVGLVDDKLRSFNPYIRLLLLFLSAAAAVGAGIGISFTTNPLSSLTFLPPTWRPPYLRLDTLAIPIEFYGPHYLVLIADIFAFLWIVTLTQVINWAKGVDGQMPGITLVAAVTLGFLSLKLTWGGDPNQLSVAKLSFIVAGSSLGFLIFNWAPAKIFPGFSGSTILAFVLATLSILSGAKLATAMLVLAVPIIDFVYTIARRISAGRSPVWGDRGHLHHKLLDLGWSAPKISLFYITVSAMLGAVALLVGTGSKLFVMLAVAVAFFGFILWLNSFGALSKRSGQNSG